MGIRVVHHYNSYNSTIAEGMKRAVPFFLSSLLIFRMLNHHMDGIAETKMNFGEL